MSEHWLQHAHGRIVAGDDELDVLADYGWVMIHGIKDGEPYTLFGQHIYELKCYVKDGEKFYQWEHIGYQKPEVR